MLEEIKKINRARAHGIVNPLTAWNQAQKAGLPYAIACAVLMQESGGGYNVFGHDPTIFKGEGKVTKTKYLAYKKARLASQNRLMQGVGPMQLTWWGFQDEADKLGGCWVVKNNMNVGFHLLHNLIAKHGEWEGLKRYNGSAIYADQVMKRIVEWRAILN